MNRVGIRRRLFLAVVATVGVDDDGQPYNVNADTVAGALVYITEGVGPAVVGLVRPRIVQKGSITVSCPICTSTSMTVLSGSTMATPAFM